MENKPLVSIIIPVYNGANYLEEAIKSALNQSYDNIEVIVVNDGSDDNNQTSDILKKYKDKIVAIEKENGGVSSALNCGIKKMKGKYFSWLSHDDIYLPNKILEEIELIKDLKDEVAVCNVDIVDENLNLIRHNHISDKFNRSVDCFLALDIDTGLNGCSLLIPKNIFEKVGLFDEKLKYTQDYDMWHRITSAGFRFELLDENLVLSRQHSQQDSKSKPIECTNACDKLHSYLVNIIKDDDLYKFYGKDFDEIVRTYNEYKIIHYNVTCCFIFEKIFSLYKKNNQLDRLKDLFNEKIIGSDSDNFFNIYNREKRKKRVCFYNNVWIRGGIERVLTILLEDLCEKYEIILLTNEKGNDCYEIPSNVTYIKLNRPIDSNLKNEIATICDLLSIDVFVGNQNMIYNLLDTYELLNKLYIKTIVFNHANYFLPLWDESLYKIFSKRLDVYPQVSAVTWPNSFGYSIYNNISDNGVLIHNPATYDVKKNVNKSKNIILCVGRFDDTIKRIDRILHVFKILLKKNPDAILYLVGTYNLDIKVPSNNRYTIRQLLLKYNIPNNNIKWFGEQKDVSKFYKEATVNILASDSEGFGMVLVEALCFGVPSVIQKIPGLDDIIENGINGYIVEQDEDEKMAESINNLLKNKDLLKKMQINSLKKAKDFDHNIFSLSFDKVFETVLKDGKINKNKNIGINKLIDYDNKIIINEYEKNIAAALLNKKNIYDCGNEVELLKNSTSWKITKPIRTIKNVINYYKQNGFIKTVKLFLYKN